MPRHYNFKLMKKGDRFPITVADRARVRSAACNFSKRNPGSKIVINWDHLNNCLMCECVQEPIPVLMPVLVEPTK